MLTEQQRTFFDTFGFLVLRQAFSPAETAAISQQFDDALASDRQGEAFGGERRQAMMGFAEQSPELTRLLVDDRIYTAIEELRGPDFVWIGSDGNLYVGDTQWHPDNPERYRRIKVAFYLDPVQKNSGCLRVIPGSHLPPLHDRLKDEKPSPDAAESPFGVAASEIPSFPLESEPGDVVFFNQSLWHASFGGRTGRRMFTFNFGAAPRSASDEENLRRTYQRNLEHASGNQYTRRDRVYTDAFLKSDSPRIQRMVAKPVALGLI
jgi:ectoine hydroxylase-related dioxygenase (phytanoyl-CoA dioxygenase family)